ncbi:MAG: ubiquinone/menaquinone biosynthesis methyltransferase [Acidimicrobiia bacterium]|nr:ubiquinone/menaquinone biosynthesis methyltransferase [Acidimicrobiia bacterium]MYE72533.1 ubiquinone/menaquinone biosynthesis methyltransferase [Acidimicrobiia bacterium]MYJ62637.1 ubiquinone/menaquinone biosynthesis methyltransferase [Acidimicrobiia bacterium]
MSGDPSLPQGQDKVAAVRSMFDAIAPRYDLLNRLLTFSMDCRWRRRAVRELGLPAESRVFDLACGTGDLCRDLESAGYQAVGFDLSAGMLRAAQKYRDSGKLSAPMVLGDALCLPVPPESADGVTCGFALRNVVDLDGLFAELARVVRPGGRISLLEVAEPSNPIMRLGHSVYFGKVIPLIGGLLSDRAAYEYLPKSVAYMPPTEEMLDTLAGRGFNAVQHSPLSGGIAQLVTATRRH